MNRVGVDAFPDWLEVRRADTLAQSDYMRDEKLASIDEAKEIYEAIVRDKECVTLKDLAVNGRDLIELGITQGKTIGNVLGNMLKDVLDYPEHNTKEYLLEPERLRDFMRDH